MIGLFFVYRVNEKTTFGIFFVCRDRKNKHLNVLFVCRGSKNKHLELLARAADSIAEGDLVDRRIRSKQAWSLLPLQVRLQRIGLKKYKRQISNISHTKSQNLNDSRLVLQFSSSKYQIVYGDWIIHLVLIWVCFHWECTDGKSVLV